MSTSSTPPRRSGGEILADALIAQGADLVFTVPGESFLPFLDALADRGERLRPITCRQEGGAAYMAEAYGKLTGRPGVCFVTRGPGACNASVGVHTAFQDSTPMLLLVGQVKRGHRGREAFQEVDFPRMFAPLAKWAGEVDTAARLPEWIARAYAAATAGRPGPAVLSIPEDVLNEAAEVADVAGFNIAPAAPRGYDLATLRALLASAHRPLMVVGGGGWRAESAAAITAFAKSNDVPVAASFRCQDIVDNECPCYVGELGTSVSPSLARAVREADLLLVVGARLGDTTTNGYTLVEAPQPSQALIHIHPDPEELGRVFRPSLGIAAGVGPTAAALADVVPVAPAPWREWTAALRREHLAERTPAGCPGDLDMSQVVTILNERLPDAVVANGAGNFSGWPQRYWRFRRYPSQLGPTNGSMGYGLPAALAATLVAAGRPVVCFTGDGDFLMTAQEMATASLHGLAPLVLVIDNGIYGTIRMHQERSFPGRVVASDLANPDFAAFARSFGAHAETVTRTEEFAPALERALGAGRAAVLHLKVDPQAITTRARLSDIGRDRTRSAS